MTELFVFEIIQGPSNFLSDVLENLTTHCVITIKSPILKLLMNLSSVNFMGKNPS